MPRAAGKNPGAEETVPTTPPPKGGEGVVGSRPVSVPIPQNQGENRGKTRALFL